MVFIVFSVSDLPPLEAAFCDLLGGDRRPSPVFSPFGLTTPLPAGLLPATPAITVLNALDSYLSMDRPRFIGAGVSFFGPIIRSLLNRASNRCCGEPFDGMGFSAAVEDASFSSG
jgi:hypothetical protein